MKVIGRLVWGSSSLSGGIQSSLSETRRSGGSARLQSSLGETRLSLLRGMERSGIPRRREAVGLFFISALKHEALL